MAAVTVAPVETTRDTDNAPPMVHYTAPPYTHGICGARLEYDPQAEPYCLPSTTVDCLVCVEMNGGVGA